MKKTLELALYAVALYAIGSNSAIAQTVKTNIPGLVLKEFGCYGGNYVGNIVNRSNRSTQGTVHIKVFDRDGDPIGGCTSHVSLEPQSGDSFSAFNCNCDAGTKFSITVK